MKNIKKISAIAITSIALMGCQSAKEIKTDTTVNPEQEKICIEAKGSWLKEYKECENVSKEWCETNKGKFNECGSACRHNPSAEVCTLQCIPVCAL